MEFDTARKVESSAEIGNEFKMPDLADRPATKVNSWSGGENNNVADGARKFALNGSVSTFDATVAWCLFVLVSHRGIGAEMDWPGGSVLDWMLSV